MSCRVTPKSIFSILFCRFKTNTSPPSFFQKMRNGVGTFKTVSDYPESFVSMSIHTKADKMKKSLPYESWLHSKKNRSAKNWQQIFNLRLDFFYIFHFEVSTIGFKKASWKKYFKFFWAAWLIHFIFCIFLKLESRRKRGKHFWREISESLSSFSTANDEDLKKVDILSWSPRPTLQHILSFHDESHFLLHSS